MIGGAYKVDSPAPKNKPFVIGAAHAPRFDSRPAVPRNDDDGFVVGAAASTGGRSGLTRPAVRRPEPRQLNKPARRRDFVVVGLRHDKK